MSNHRKPEPHSLRIAPRRPMLAQRALIAYAFLTAAAVAGATAALTLAMAFIGWWIAAAFVAGTGTFLAVTMRDQVLRWAESLHRRPPRQLTAAQTRARISHPTGSRLMQVADLPTDVIPAVPATTQMFAHYLGRAR